MKMTNKKMIELVKENHGGLAGATDGQLLAIAKSLPAGTLERYEKNRKVKTEDANS